MALTDDDLQKKRDEIAALEKELAQVHAENEARAAERDRELKSEILDSEKDRLQRLIARAKAINASGDGVVTDPPPPPPSIGAPTPPATPKQNETPAAPAAKAEGK